MRGDAVVNPGAVTEAPVGGSVEKLPTFPVPVPVPAPAAAAVGAAADRGPEGETDESIALNYKVRIPQE